MTDLARQTPPSQSTIVEIKERGLTAVCPLPNVTSTIVEIKERGLTQRENSKKKPTSTIVEIKERGLTEKAGEFALGSTIVEIKERGLTPILPLSPHTSIYNSRN